ncbi:hypothetical protein JCM10207_001509 [Rhodosporidiobolus poonsookiae]
MRRRSSIALPSFGARRGSVSSNASSQQQLKDDIVRDIFHVGLVNLGNSCFYNTIVQALSATQPLNDIISAAPSSSPALQALSPSSPSYNPDLDALPSPLPMTAALLILLDKLDPTNPRNGANGAAPIGKKAFNPKSLLRQLSLKHDEYAEATQQDSHELLRHLVDGVFMEEQDLIKKIAEHPPSHGPSAPRRPSMHARSTTVRAVVDGVSGDALVPEDAVSESSASVHGVGSAVDSAEEEVESESESETDSSDSSSGDEAESESEEQKRVRRRKRTMRPFVGSIFEGKLASFIICDECKNVSLTKEDFMDLSLSLKDDNGNRMRKRDRIRRTLQAGFFSRKKGDKSSGKESGDDVKQAPNGVSRTERVSLSENEGSASASEADETDDDRVRAGQGAGLAKQRTRHLSLDPTTSSRESARALLRPDSAAGSARASRDPSPLGRALSVLSRGSEGGSHHHHFLHRRAKIPKPTKEQIAYIKKVLVDIPGPAPPSLPPGLRVARPPGSSPAASPQPPSSPALGAGGDDGVSSAASSLTNLRLSAPAPSVDWQGTDLFECFRQFTAVEVLEGENSFACRNCWRALNPDLEAQRKRERAERREERQKRRAARSQSMGNGSVTAAVEVDGEGHELRPGDVARAEARKAAAAAAGLSVTPLSAGVKVDEDALADEEEEDSDADDGESGRGDRTARNTPAASPRMPFFSGMTPDASIPPIEPLPATPAEPASPLKPTTGKTGAALRHFSISSAATSASVSVDGSGTDYDGGVSSEAFETTTDEEGPDSPDLDDERSLSGSVAELGSIPESKPLTMENVEALSPPTPAAANGKAGANGTGHLAVPQAGAAPSSTGGSVSGRSASAPAPASPAPSVTSASAKPSRPPPKAQRHILRRAHKRYLISAEDLPPVLVVHLKRFMQTSKSSLFGSAFVNLKKRDDPVSFPREMDLSPFLAPEGKPPRPRREGGEEVRTETEEEVQVEKEVLHVRYRLYAAVVHFGTIDTGHYATYVLSNRYGKGDVAGKGDRKWVFCSDEEVTAVSEAEVLRSKAYMLFYERVPASSEPLTSAALARGASASSAVSDSSAANSPRPAQLPTLVEPPATIHEGQATSPAGGASPVTPTAA